MPNKPELLIYQSLRSLFTKHLPKGRWLLQRIETSTGTGIPDCYCSLLINERHLNLWIETKTTEYKVSNEQLNWAYQHTLSGGLTYIVTRINQAKTAAKNAPTTAHNPPNASSNLPTHANPYPALLLLGSNSLQPYEQLINAQRKDELVFLSFDDRMRECSTLGVYLRRFNPDVLLVSDWVTSMCAQS
jgi:hypothetical protein